MRCSARRTDRRKLIVHQLGLVLERRLDLKSLEELTGINGARKLVEGKPLKLSIVRKLRER